MHASVRASPCTVTQSPPASRCPNRISPGATPTLRVLAITKRFSEMPPEIKLWWRLLVACLLTMITGRVFALATLNVSALVPLALAKSARGCKYKHDVRHYYRFPLKLMKTQ